MHHLRTVSKAKYLKLMVASWFQQVKKKKPGTWQRDYQSPIYIGYFCDVDPTITRGLKTPLLCPDIKYAWVCLRKDSGLFKSTGFLKNNCPRNLVTNRLFGPVDIWFEKYQI